MTSSSQLLLGGLALALSVGCAARNLPEQENVEDGLPRWMTHGEEVKLDLAQTFLDNDNTFYALDIIRQMRADGANSPELDLMQGVALRIEGVYSESERLLAAAQKKMSKDARPCSELCILMADQGRVDEAITHCARASELDNTNPQIWNNLAFLLLSGNRAQDALVAASEAVRLDGTNALYRNNLALAQAATGKTDQAFRTFHSTMRKPDAAYMVGLAVERFDGFADARPWYERTLESNPDHKWARQKLYPQDDGADAPVENP